MGIMGDATDTHNGVLQLARKVHGSQCSIFRGFASQP